MDQWRNGDLVAARRGSDLQKLSDSGAQGQLHSRRSPFDLDVRRNRMSQATNVVSSGQSGVHVSLLIETRTGLDRYPAHISLRL